MATVRIKLDSIWASGRRKGWWRQVTNVDLSKTNGFAFFGEFLRAEQELDIDVGAVVISKAPTGSASSGSHDWKVYVVQQDGKLEERACHDHAEFLTFRNTVAKLLEVKKPDPLQSFTDEEIKAEFIRRGLSM